MMLLMMINLNWSYCKLNSTLTMIFPWKAISVAFYTPFSNNKSILFYSLVVSTIFELWQNKSTISSTLKWSILLAFVPLDRASLKHRINKVLPGSDNRRRSSINPMTHQLLKSLARFAKKISNPNSCAQCVQCFSPSKDTNSYWGTYKAAFCTRILDTFQTYHVCTQNISRLYLAILALKTFCCLVILREENRYTKLRYNV